MPPSTRDDALHRFLASYFADEDAEQLRSADAYASADPEHGETIRAAYEQLQHKAIDTVQEGIPGFELLREIGRGGQGLVYLAREASLDRLVAIKLLGSSRLGTGAWTERMRSRFEREALLASRLQHPSICPIYSMGVHDGRPFLVMHFLVGRTVHEIVREGRMPIDDALRRFEGAARALHFAHEEGIVHRDVKASNLFLTEDDRVVLLDFGVARELSTDVELTMTGDMVGTLPFLSPEQVLGRDVDRRSDVYSLAVTLYEALTGSLPFDAPTQRSLMNAIVHDEPAQPGKLGCKLPRDLRIVLETGLEKDITRRYQSAEDFADELARVRNKEAIQARPAGVPRRVWRFAQRQPKLAASLIVTILTLSIGMAVSLTLLTQVQEEERRTRFALEEIDMLTDRTRLEELQAAILSFEPPNPARLDDMREWLARADALLARLPEHERVLRELRSRATKEIDGGDKCSVDTKRLVQERARLARSRAFLESEVAKLKASDGSEKLRAHREREISILDQIEPKIEEAIAADRHWRFENARDYWRHGLQDLLVRELTDFRDKAKHTRGRKRVQGYYDFALQLREREAQDRDAWERCGAEIADPERSPAYRGLRIAAQLGLVPLGKDPKSGLYEFAHLQTGKVPKRDAKTGALNFGDESGMVFVLVPGGRARIGARRGRMPGAHVDPNAEKFESPVHTVELDAFLISKFEVTQGQWVRMMRLNPSQGRIGNTLTGSPPVTARNPVEGLSWDAARFPRTLRLRLPDERAVGIRSARGDDDGLLDGELTEEPARLRQHRGTLVGAHERAP